MVYYCFVHVYVCGLFIDLFVNENGICPFTLMFLCMFRFMVGISPRIGVVVMSLNLGGDNPFLLVNVCINYRACGVFFSFLPMFFLFGI